MKVDISLKFGTLVARVIGGPGPRRVTVYRADLAGRKLLGAHTGYQMTPEEYQSLQEAIAAALVAAGHPVPATLLPCK